LNMRTIKPGPDEIPSSDLYDYVVGNHSNPGSYICYGIHIETLTFAWNTLLVSGLPQTSKLIRSTNFS
jgi:hypothetical protein